jgi:trehalose/maltose hydrolase-like predicted phosphorylase
VIDLEYDGRNLIENRFVPDLAGWRESVFTIANGYLSTRGSFEEPTPGETRASFLNGVFVEPPGELPLLGALPDWTRVDLTVDGEAFDLVTRPPAGYQRRLDMTSGVLTRRVLWRGPETGTIRLEVRRMVSMADRSLAVLEVTVTALSDPVEIELGTGLDQSVGSPLRPAWRPIASGRTSQWGMSLETESVDGAHRLTTSCVLVGAEAAEWVDDQGHPRFRLTTMLAAGESLRLLKIVAYGVDGATTDLPAPTVTFDELAAASEQHWRQRWETSTIEIDGDRLAEGALRFAAFQLIGAASPDDPRAGIGARLMSGFGYRHHVFWDADIFVVPYLTITQPDLARCHLGYRFRGLDGARRKASRLGRSGAFYAWEAAGTGDEVTPTWSEPASGAPVRIWTGDIEEHITADVAWAADHYWRWTGDDPFMAGEGVEMIVEGARYWADRLEVEDDGAHIRDVIGPDEYHIHVDDSFYTNLLAAWQLRRAATAFEWLAAEHPERHRLLAEGREWEPRLAERMAGLADQMVLRARPDRVWEQHAGFFGLEPFDLAQYEPRVKTMFDLLGEDRLQTTAVIKQADVLMAGVLLPEPSGGIEALAANWDYYAAKSDHGSSLSLGFHALAAALLGHVEEAYESFLRATSIDFADAMGNGSAGIHAACQGGLLQAAIFGFAGLRLSGPDPVLAPNLPDHWKSMAFTFMHNGTRHDRVIDDKPAAPSVGRERRPT